MYVEALLPARACFEVMSKGVSLLVAILLVSVPAALLVSSTVTPGSSPTSGSQNRSYCPPSGCPPSLFRGTIPFHVLLNGSSVFTTFNARPGQSVIVMVTIISNQTVSVNITAFEQPIFSGAGYQAPVQGITIRLSTTKALLPQGSTTVPLLISVGTDATKGLHAMEVEVDSGSIGFGAAFNLNVGSV